MRLSTPLPLVVACVAVLSSPAVRAESCPAGSSHGSYVFVDYPRPLDGRPWVGLDGDELARLQEREPSCVLARVGTQEVIPASVEVSPSSRESFPTEGCGSGVAFASTLVRLIPETRLEPASRYQIQCDGDYLFESGGFFTGDHVASPAPELMVESVGTEEWCDTKRLMRLDVRGLDSRFWEEGGVILAEYESGAIDWVGMEPPDSGPVVLELPEEGDEVLTLTVVNGAGVAGPPLELDVTAVAGSRGLEGCATGPHPRSSSLLIFGVLMMLRGRGRSRARPRARRCGAARVVA